jgi:2-iminoacetate synthase
VEAASVDGRSVEAAPAKGLRSRGPGNGPLNPGQLNPGQLYDMAELRALTRGADPRTVPWALDPAPGDLTALAVLLSPAARPHLEDLAHRARRTALQRFGRTVRLFAPLYLSNHCLSTCTYCGFARDLALPRRTLTCQEARAEAESLVDQGFRHLLLVAGEHRTRVSPDYLGECLLRLRDLVPSLSIETQTWTEPVYERLVRAGLEGVVHYQETYDRDRYRQVHPSGWKRDYDRRLAAFDAAGRAGTRRLGLGVLLGLAPDWRSDVLALAAHASALRRTHWRTEVTVSLPRITPSASGFQPVTKVSDTEFVQAVTALRVVLPDVGIVLSTREAAPLRDGLIRIGVTHLSAGSRTEPGGYREPGTAQEQFTVIDDRTPSQVAGAIVAAGCEPVFQDALPLGRIAGERRGATER